VTTQTVSGDKCWLTKYKRHNQPLEPIAARWAAPAQLYVMQGEEKEKVYGRQLSGARRYIFKIVQ
jgi:hypothetical protein